VNFNKYTINTGFNFTGIQRYTSWSVFDIEIGPEVELDSKVAPEVISVLLMFLLRLESISIIICRQ
jgi:hypothetical protein